MHFRDDAADRRMAETGSLLKYLPRIVAYPLSGHALPAVLMLSVLLWFGVQSILGIALFAISAPWVFHYAEAVIDNTAAGRATAPQFGGDMIYLGGVRALRPLVGVGAIAGAWMLAGNRGEGAQLAVLIVGAFLFPAYMLVVSVGKSLVAAFNPLQLFAVMARVGRAYFAVCLILAGSVAAVVMIANKAALFVSLFVALYLWVMTFHLLGYVAFHRAKELGLEVKVAAPTDESRRMDEQNARLAAVLRNIDAALNRRDLDAAGKALYADPGGPADVRLFHEELFEQMQRRRNPTLVHAQGQRLVTQLLREKRVPRALEIAETCYDVHPDFVTEQPAHAVVLAEAALQARREGLFERLTRDAPKRYGKDAAVLSLAFLTAKYWAEFKRDDDRAREILKPLLAQSGHPLHRQIAAYAKALGA
jgi:hypothetical protein